MCASEYVESTSRQCVRVPWAASTSPGNKGTQLLSGMPIYVKKLFSEIKILHQVKALNRQLKYLNLTRVPEKETTASPPARDW